MDSTAMRALSGRRALVSVLALGLSAAALLALVRRTIGVPFGSDAYSYLSWAHGAVHDGSTGHVASDYTVQKPLELAAAAVGELAGWPLGVFGWWTMLGLVGAVAAAAALGERLAGPPGAVCAALLALLAPVLWRWSLAGDSNVPYAALAVGAATAGAGTLPASGMLAAAGLLRPEAWGLAAVSAILGWPRASRGERAAALAATVVPPIAWLALDRAFSGDALRSTHVVDRYVTAYHPPLLGVADLPGAVTDRVPDVIGWPLAALGVAALVVGLRRCPLDAAVVFPLALLVALALSATRDQLSRDDLGRMLTALCLFAAAGGGALLGSLPWRARGLAPLALAACAAAVLVGTGSARPALRDAFSAASAQARLASDLEQRVGPRAARRLGARGLVQTERGWQAAFALYAGLERRRVVTGLLARQRGLRPGAFLVRRGQRRPAAARRGPPAVTGRRWLLLLRRQAR